MLPHHLQPMMLSTFSTPNNYGFWGKICTKFVLYHSLSIVRFSLAFVRPDGAWKLRALEQATASTMRCVIPKTPPAQRGIDRNSIVDNKLWLNGNNWKFSAQLNTHDMRWERSAMRRICQALTQILPSQIFSRGMKSFINTKSITIN